MRSPELHELPPPPPGKTGWPWTEGSPRLPERMPDGRAWPRLTVVTPNYNYEQFIEETIRSVLLQGYPDLEYIVIDGNSSDRSAEIVRKYEKWISFWKTGESCSQAQAINQGFARATGEMLAWLNSDDTYEPGAAGAAMQALQPGVDVVWGECRYIDEHSVVSWQWEHAIPQAAPLTLDRWVVCWKDYPARQPSVFWRRSVQAAVGPLDESFRYAMDYDLFLRFADRGYPFHHLPKTLSNFRLHKLSKTVGQSDKFVPEILRASSRYWGPRDSLRYWRTSVSAQIWLKSIRLAGEAINASRFSQREAATRLVRSLAAFPFSFLIAPRTIGAAMFRTAFGWNGRAEQIRSLLTRF
jgi:glycosyltransferase involved in cell wall biosynthesis